MWLLAHTWKRSPGIQGNREYGVGAGRRLVHVSAGCGSGQRASMEAAACNENSKRSKLNSGKRTGGDHSEGVSIMALTMKLSDREMPRDHAPKLFTSSHPPHC
jgi:hypothetical protein